MSRILAIWLLLVVPFVPSRPPYKGLPLPPSSGRGPQAWPPLSPIGYEIVSWLETYVPIILVSLFVIHIVSIFVFEYSDKIMAKRRLKDLLENIKKDIDKFKSKIR